MSDLVEVTFLNTGETELVRYLADDDFEVTLNGQTSVMELDRAEACKRAGVLVSPPDEHGDEVLTIIDVWGVDKTTYD